MADSFSNPKAKSWSLKSRSNDTLVHTRKLEGSNYHVVRLITEMTTTPEEIVTAFGKGVGCVSWLARCHSSEILEKISDDNILSYSVIGMPWPLKTRDYVFRSTTRRHAESGVITLTQVGEPKKHPPRNYIRMLTQSKFILEPISTNKTKVTWFIHPNLRGNAFPSIVNSRAVGENLRDLLSLKNLVEN